eukprot:TRINITY_DN1858_c0_g1_i2.p1 TRINITY_DN1858_c0_g1~~TRINITY_DN1858_c0_g1_i2.p1  ORF type:complete len:205 (+),score=34.08 TRINITY_DN1858_c0_g1_i2:332-946(+)
MDELGDLDEDPTLSVRRGLEKASRGIEEATTNLMRLKHTRTLSQTDSEVSSNARYYGAGTPPQDEGSMSPEHMQDIHIPAAHQLPQLPRVALPGALVPNAVPMWGDNSLNFEEPAMQVGKLPVGKLHNVPFQGGYDHHQRAYEEGEVVPPAMEYAFRASLTPNEGQSDVESVDESESDTDYEREDEAIKIRMIKFNNWKLKLSC